MPRKNLVELRTLVADEIDCPILMVRFSKRALKHVREWGMANIVDQRGRFDRTFVLVQQLLDSAALAVPCPQRIDDPLRKVEYAEAMRKAAVLRSMVSKPRNSELANASQSLQLRRVNQIENKLIGWRDPYEAMYGIAKNLAG